MAYGQGQVLGGVGYDTPIHQMNSTAQVAGERQPEIARYTDELQGLLQSCLQSADRLEDRVLSVSRSDPPSPTGNNACEVASAPQSPYGQRLDALCEIARNVLNRIDGMARRLEV